MPKALFPAGAVSPWRDSPHEGAVTRACRATERNAGVKEFAAA